MRVPVAIAAAVLGILSSPTAASATTRYVDDDHAQCGQARYTTVQAAIDASAAGDVVRVCGGTYAEQVVVPADEAGLQLKSLPLGGPHAALIVPPPNGLAFHPEISDDLGLVLLAAERAKLVGFRLAGQLNQADMNVGCGSGADVVVSASGISVDRNHIDVTPPSCGISATGIAIHYDGAADIDRNVIEGSGAGIVDDANGRVNIQRNRVTGRFLGGIVVAFAAPARVAGNDVEALSGDGISTELISVKLFHNHVRRSGGNGISLAEGTSGLVWGNVVSDSNRSGILEGSIRFRWGMTPSPISMTIRANQTLDNGRDGIEIGRSEIPAPNFIYNNISRGNGHLDCLDENFGSTDPLVDPSFYHWSHNIGPTADPRSICHPH